MSTVWYARRSGHVVSIESFEPWYKKIGHLLRSAGNVDYRFVPDREAYVNAPEGPFDLIMIDGGWRDGCAESALTQLAPGGVIYLDNSDMGHNRETNSDVPRARKILLDFAKLNGLPVREFTDFAPTQFHVQRGLMVGGPKS